MSYISYFNLVTFSLTRRLRPLSWQENAGFAFRRSFVCGYSKLKVKIRDAVGVELSGDSNWFASWRQFFFSDQWRV